MHNRDPEDDTDVSAALSGSYGRLRELFVQVFDIDEAERDAWIASNVANPEEREALRRLLAADNSGEGFLDVAADQHAARMDIEDALRPGMMIGQRIGAFRLTRLLGKGGMAAVFLGERDSGDFHQHVAVKLLRRGLYSDVEQRLFRRERQLLAGLEHPNISRLIDGGITPAGVPYLVIEFVDGLPITQYAADKRLTVHQRLDLFLIVCRAVEAAHRALIVHRDIKPSNILVSADGNVKLLDFGIAKILDEDSESPTVGVFTPDYAAPEQLASLPITTATDVYALGILLYELLLGSRPHGNVTKRPSSLARGTASAQSSVPNPLVLPRALRGDIDTIILKCLETEPQQRYASASALADDVARYLAGKPVEAHPPSRWYRTRKFVQRHRGSVAITALLVVAIFAALGMAIWQANVAWHEAARAREVQGFVESLFQPLTEGVAPDKAPSLQQLLTRGIDRIDTSFHDDLRAQADLLDMFSRIQDQLGEIKANRDLSERAYRVTEKLYGPSDPRTLDTREKHARILYRLGEFDESLKELTAVRAAMQAADIHGTSLATTLEDTAFVRSAQGSTDDELIALNQDAVKARETDPQSTPENLAAGYNNLALAYYHANQLDRTLELFQKAHALFAQAKGESYVTATSLANIGGAQFRMGRWRDGLATQIEAREMFRRIGIENHQMLVGILTGICETAGDLELDDQAKIACDDGVAMSAKVLGENHPRFVRSLIYRANAEIGAAQFDAATTDLDRARSLATDIKGAGVPAIRAVDMVAANMDRLRGDYAQLRMHLSASIPIASNADSTSAPTLFAWFALACARAPGEGCGADDEKHARQILADSKLAHQPNQLAAENALAQIDLLHGDAKKAIDDVNRGLDIAAHELGDKHSWVGEAHLILGDAHAALGDHAAALTNYQAAAKILDERPSAHPLRHEADARLRKAENSPSAIDVGGARQNLPRQANRSSQAMRSIRVRGSELHSN